MPPVTLGVLIIIGLRFYGVPVWTTAIFAGYVALGIALPGMLLWRAVRGRSGWLVEDVAAGLAVGYSCEVMTYIAARWIGVPLLTAAWPVATIAVFLLVPKLRRYWRGTDRADEKTPFWFSAILSGGGLVLFYWSIIRFFRTHGLVEPGSLSPDIDSPFHLALLGDAKHHMPLASPWLPEQPVLYHWFVYAEMASTSWITGIEPEVLLLRLSPLPMILGLLVLMAVLGKRLTGQWWCGAAAVVITFFVLTPTPYQWPLNTWFSAYGTNVYEDGSSLRAQLWTSPTQTFGAILFAALVLVLVDVLTESNRKRWLLVALLMAAITGGKATFLPMLLAGVLLVIAVRLLVRRQVRPPALIVAGVAFLALLFAQFVLFGGAAQGLAIDPLHFAQISGAPFTAKFAVPGQAGLLRLLLVAAITVACWACIWPGLVGLTRFVWRRRPDLQIPAEPVVLVLGIGLSGIGALFVFGHEGGAEGWFMVSGRPYLSLAAVVGLAMITPSGVPTRRMLTWVYGAIAVGAASLIVIHQLGQTWVPTAARAGSSAKSAFYLVWPYAAVFGLLGIAVLLVIRSSFPAKGTVVVSLLAGVCLVTTPLHLHETTRQAEDTGWRDINQYQQFIPAGTMQAGRWLRDHSGPDDLVATNAHCFVLAGENPTQCDNRHFAFAAYSERRFLIEGWGFTSRAHEVAAEIGVNDVVVPYWNQQLLSDNDAAFISPSAATIDKLRDQYGVRWLFVLEASDPSAVSASPSLGEFAQLRHRAGKIAVYEIR
ncbi:hypothetical protein GCM10009827_036590 [Dactylosporangium maewongense]|uniref:Uncharacterized protein n=1 Tax=Dactylosporangium maewongense TaxID=634393 RepID=A0ABN2AFY8_9ACTN